MRQFKFTGTPDEMFSKWGIDVVKDIIYNEDYKFQAKGKAVPLLEIYHEDPGQWEVVDHLTVYDHHYRDLVAMKAMRDYQGPVDNHSDLAKFAYDRAYAMWEEKQRRLNKL